MCFAQAEEQHELWPCIQGQFLEPETDAEADGQMAIHTDSLVNTKWDHLPEVRSSVPRSAILLIFTNYYLITPQHNTNDLNCFVATSCQKNRIPTWR